MTILRCNVALYPHGAAAPTWTGTFANFLKANPTLTAEEVSDITVCLMEKREYEGGGGAEGRYALDLLEDDEDEPEPWEEWPPVDTPSLDDTFHRIEMDTGDDVDTAIEEGTRFERAIGDGNDLGG